MIIVSFALAILSLQCAVGDAPPPGNIYEQEGISGDSTWDLDVSVSFGFGKYFRFAIANPSLIYDDNKHTVLFDSMDRIYGPLLVHAAAVKMKPMYLFSYYPNLQYNGLGVPVGNYSKWYQTGRQFALRYGPGGTFIKQNNLAGDFGIRVWSMFNEADICDVAYGKQAWNLQEYYWAVLGLAQGIRSVDAGATIFPGGFASPDYYAQPVLKGGFGELLAPLWNNRTLDAIDLHMYTNNDRMKFYLSSQVFFAGVRKNYKIRDDVSFVSSEFNYYTNATESQREGARGLLTTSWDVWGTVQADGHSSATYMATPFDYFQTFPQASYGLSTVNEPGKAFQLSDKGNVLVIAHNLSMGLSFTSLDPYNTGVYELEGTPNGVHKKLIVWQNRPTWTSIKGSTLDIQVGKPSAFTDVDVYGYTGLLTQLKISDSQVSASGTFPVSNLPVGQTYMILAWKS